MKIKKESNAYWGLVSRASKQKSPRGGGIAIYSIMKNWYAAKQIVEKYSNRLICT